MNHFNPKSLAFYGTAIGFVLLVFKFVTLYGENRLQAAPPIAGTYRLNPSAPSSCVGKNASLSIEQSGIYLLGTLSTGRENIALDGRFQGEKFHLSGRVGDGKDCTDPMIIEATARDKSLEGTIAGVAFTAEKAEETPESSSIAH
jgi:hypothetical protein